LFSLQAERSLSPPTPFPYTTLFRSDEDPVERARSNREREVVVHQHRVDAPAAAQVDPAAGLVAEGRDRDAVLKRDPAAADGLEADRKSTRLNSSHGSISYAVFCLKK